MDEFNNSDTGVNLIDSLYVSGNVYANNTFYMENFLLSVFGSALGFYVALVILVLMCFFSEYKKSGFIAAGCFAVFSLLVYYWGGENTKFLLAILNWQVIVAYLGIGLVHTIYRFYIEGRKFGSLISEKRIEWKKANGVAMPVVLTPAQENQFRYWIMGKEYDYKKLQEKIDQETDEQKKAEIIIHEYSLPEVVSHIADNVENSKFKHYQIINPKTSAFRWWFNWPVSLVYYFFSEMFSEMWDLAWGKVKKLLNSFFMSGIKATSKEKA